MPSVPPVMLRPSGPNWWPNRAGGAHDQVEGERKAGVHGAGGQDAHPDLAAGPTVVVDDVLGDEGGGGGEQEERDQYLRTGERGVPGCRPSPPESLQGVDRLLG